MAKEALYNGHVSCTKHHTTFWVGAGCPECKKEKDAETKPKPKMVEKPLRFFCSECGYTFRLDTDEDPTSSTGCCKNCGSGRWSLTDIRTRERVD